MLWRIRLKAVIDDEVDVEADTEEEAIAAAHADWSFTEAQNWEEEVVDRPGYVLTRGGWVPEQDMEAGQ